MIWLSKISSTFLVGLKSSVPSEQSIHTEIFTDYNSNVKPDGLINNTVQVHLDVAVLKLSFLVTDYLSEWGFTHVKSEFSNLLSFLLGVMNGSISNQGTETILPFSCFSHAIRIFKTLWHSLYYSVLFSIGNLKFVEMYFFFLLRTSDHRCCQSKPSPHW